MTRCNNICNIFKPPSSTRLCLLVTQEKIQKLTLNDRVLSLLFRSHIFEFHKSSEPLEAYMVVNFRTREINRGTHNLIRIPMLINFFYRNPVCLASTKALYFQGYDLGGSQAS